MEDIARYGATIGFFDGVHRGHRYLLGHLIEESARRGLRSMVITFDKHPRQVLQQAWQPQLLTTTEEKALLLQATGVDAVKILPFTHEMAALTAKAFMERLHNELAVDYLLVGYDHRFGHNRAETPNQYVDFGREIGMEVEQWKPALIKGTAISSSLVRRLLGEGRVAEAAEALGRPYQMDGTVEPGRQVGRQLGYPTANLLSDEMGKITPASSAYAVWARVDEEARWRPAMMNIGTCPTFHGSERTLEVHLIDYCANLYGHRLSVQFVAKLRDETAFSSPDALAAQLEQDRRKALSILK